MEYRREFVVTATPPEILVELCGLEARQYPPQNTETTCAMVRALRACGYDVVVEAWPDGRIVASGDEADVFNRRAANVTPEFLAAL